MEDRTTIQVSYKLRKDLKILAAKRDISYQELLKEMMTVFKELDKEKTLVSVPKKLSEKINSHLKNTDFSSVSEYIAFALRLILSEHPDPQISKAEKTIKERLKRLGYI